MVLLLDKINISLIITSCLNLLLATAVYLNDTKQKVNKAYSIITLTIIFWVASMILYRSAPQESAIFWCTILYVSASLIASTFLYFTYIFPPHDSDNTDTKTFLIFFTNLILAFMILWPGLIIQNVTVVPGHEKAILFTKYYWFYFLYIFGFFSYGFWRLRQKYLTYTGTERKQVLFVFFGYSITGNLAFVTNLVLPWVGIFIFNWIGQLFTIIIVSFTSYAILRHKLFNFKVVATEILTFLLIIASAVQLAFSKSILEVGFRFALFLLMTGFGFLLIKSVLKEIKQREQLELLTNQLGEANEKLKALDLARAEFISIASHQLRTPPATIKWYLSSVLSGDYGKIPGPIEEKLKVVQQTTNHLISLIEDMLNVSRIERGKMEFLFEPTDTEELARLAYEQLIPIAQTKKLSLTYEGPKEKLPKVMADKEKLRQVMNNMIDNAIKYTKAGTVDVKILKKADTIQFQVKDSGKGISDVDRNSIFQKYSRGKESIKQSAGLGLGLYVAKIIIEQHKGKIWAESEGEGKGSTFLFSIPIHNNLKQTTLVDLVAEQTKK